MALWKQILVHFASWFSSNRIWNSSPFLYLKLNPQKQNNCMKKKKKKKTCLDSCSADFRIIVPTSPKKKPTMVLLWYITVVLCQIKYYNGFLGLVNLPFLLLVLTEFVFKLKIYIWFKIILVCYYIKNICRLIDSMVKKWWNISWILKCLLIKLGNWEMQME